jgi:hypothetical protein
MSNPTLASLETRIRILERHVETLERAAKVTRRKQRGWDASICPHGTDESEGWCAQCVAGLPGPEV